MLSSRPGAAPEPTAGVEELRGLVEEYRGFGMFSLIRVLLGGGWRHWGLAVLSVMLLVGQWAGRDAGRGIILEYCGCCVCLHTWKSSLGVSNMRCFGMTSISRPIQNFLPPEGSGGGYSVDLRIEYVGGG